MLLLFFFFLRCAAVAVVVVDFLALDFLVTVVVGAAFCLAVQLLLLSLPSRSIAEDEKEVVV